MHPRIAIEAFGVRSDATWNVLARVDFIIITDEKATEFTSGRMQLMTFPCPLCGLERSKFGPK
jgi:hypothetical protein